MRYGELIRKIRNSKNMTLDEFAKLTMCDRGNLGRLEKSFNISTGKRISPSIDTLKQICDRTGYSFRQFLEEAEYIEKPEILEVFDNLSDEQKAKLLESAKGFLKHDESDG